MLKGLHSKILKSFRSAHARLRGDLTAMFQKRELKTYWVCINLQQKETSKLQLGKLTVLSLFKNTASTCGTMTKEIGKNRRGKKNYFCLLDLTLLNSYIIKHHYHASITLASYSGLAFKSWPRDRLGRAIAQAVSCWLPTAVAWVQTRVWSSGICGGQSGTGAGFLRVLRFPLSIFIPPNSPSS
jgi:hypothetical protein